MTDAMIYADDGRWDLTWTMHNTLASCSTLWFTLFWDVLAVSSKGINALRAKA